MKTLKDAPIVVQAIVYVACFTWLAYLLYLIKTVMFAIIKFYG